MKMTNHSTGCVKLSSLLNFTLFATLSINAQNLQKDILLGEQYSAYVEETVGVYQNPDLTAYVKAVGDKLTAQMDEPLFEYKYSILATEEPNAFSIPGGHLYITTGMFPFLESEDELACIMAHEIIHANNRHVIKSNRRGIIPGILQIPGALIGAVVDENLGNVLQSPFARLGSLTHASYSRKQETEADIEGIEIAAKAGYDPNALKSILSRLGRYGELVSGEQEEKDRFATHPMTEQRVEKIDKVEPNLQISEHSAIAEDIYEMTNGTLAGSDPSKGVVVNNTFVNPAMNFSLTFPDEWEIGFMSNVIAAASEEDDFIRVVFEGSDDDPTEAAEEFIAELNPYYRDMILGSEPISVGDKKGHLIAFTAESEGKKYYGSKTWVRQDTLIFDFLAVSTSEKHRSAEKIIGSLKQLTIEDFQKIKVPILRILEVEPEESPAEFLERTGSDQTEEVLLLINQKTASDGFNEGEKVKVVVTENYLE